MTDLDAFVKEHIVERLGHSNLNQLQQFQDVVPTTENLCRELYQVLENGFVYAKVEKVRMEETMLNSVEYAGGKEIRR